MGAIVGRSLERLNTCHPKLQEIVHAANAVMEVSVLCGARSKAEQDKAYAERKTKVQYPNSKHNITDDRPESLAVDLIPYHASGKTYSWEDHLAFARLAGVMMTVAHQMGVPLRWGGDWDRDGRSEDEKFLDLVHFELDY